jgi:hypothetical protein
LVMIGKNIAGHLVNPRLKPIAFAIAVSVFNQSQKNILRQVFGQHGVIGELSQKIENSFMVTIKQKRSLLKLTVFHGFHNLFIGSQSRDVQNSP